MTVAERGGGRRGGQELHDRRVDEGEPIVLSPYQQTPGADDEGCLLLIDLRCAQVGQSGAYRVRQACQVGSLFAAVPQHDGQLVDRLPKLTGDEGLGARGRLAPCHLVVQPPVDERGVKIRGADRAVGGARCEQVRLRQFGDERQHPRVRGQAQQIVDGADQLKAGIRLPLRLGLTFPLVNGPGGDSAGEQLPEKLPDLRLVEIVQADRPAARVAAHEFAELGPPLVVVGEVLGTAGQDDFCPARDRRHDHA